MKRRCWRPSCGVTSYLHNPDYFMYWWKPAVRVLRIAPSTWRKELAEAKAESAEAVAALNTELDEVRANHAALAQETKEELASVRSELEMAREEIRRARAEAADAVADARQELVDYKAEQGAVNAKWADLNADLRSDVDNLRDMLMKHKRDDLRSVVLWPSGCGWRCSRNYKGIYGIWTTLSTRLVKVYNTRWAGWPCGRRLRVMRRTFTRWCEPYPEPMRVRLLGYYDYLVAGKACSW